MKNIARHMDINKQTTQDNIYFKGRNFRGKKNREIFTFRCNKLSRMTSYEKFRWNKLSR